MGARQRRPNKSFKPNPLRYANHMAGTACHVVRSTTLLGLTLVLGLMSRNRASSRADSDLTLGGRLAAAFGSLFFSAPVIGVLWLIFNSKVALVSDRVIPLSYLGGAILGFAVFSFVFPRFSALYLAGSGILQVALPSGGSRFGRSQAM